MATPGPELREDGNTESGGDADAGRAADGAAPVSPAGSRRGRLAISVFVAATVLAVLTAVAPDSALRNQVLTVAGPYLAVTGLDQRWGVFAPDPRGDTSHVGARIDRLDATSGYFWMDEADGVAEYWNYRWRKYGEQLWSAPGTDREREAFAGWLVAGERAAGHEPVQVTLLRRTTPTLAPGSGPDAGPPSEVAFWSTVVAAP